MPRATTKTASSKPSAQEMPANHEEKLAAFREALRIANKEIASDDEFESGPLISLLSDKPREVETFSTGSVLLDSLLGGGIAKGRLVEIYGPEASGKTSVALTVAGNVQKTGGTAALIDLENAFDPKYARKLGVNIKELAVSQPSTAEQALKLCANLAKSRVVDLIIVDSIAAMVPREELEGGVDKVTVGLLARLMSKGLRQLVGIANKTGTTIIFINQVRDQIGGFSPFGVPQTTPGGKAMKFYASQRIEVKKKGRVDEGKIAIGTQVKMKVIKNKIAPPFGEGETVLTFNRGINQAAEMIEVGPKFGIIERPNNRTYVNALTGQVMATSKADAVYYLDHNPEVLAALSEKLKEAVTNDLFSEVDTDEEVDPEAQVANTGSDSDDIDLDLEGDDTENDAISILKAGTSGDELDVESDDV